MNITEVVITHEDITQWHRPTNYTKPTKKAQQGMYNKGITKVMRYKGGGGQGGNGNVMGGEGHKSR